MAATNQSQPRFQKDVHGNTWFTDNVNYFYVVGRRFYKLKCNPYGEYYLNIRDEDPKPAGFRPVNG